MPTAPPPLQDCNCFALRSATRHLTQFYDQFVAPLGLRATQFSILARLKRKGPLTINVLAEELVMDRTTLGRNILPLERERLIRIEPAASDRRVDASAPIQSKTFRPRLQKSQVMICLSNERVALFFRFAATLIAVAATAAVSPVSAQSAAPAVACVAPPGIHSL